MSSVWDKVRVVDMKLKAVLFDLGGTLIQTIEVPQIFKRILEIYGVEADTDQILEALEANQKEFNLEEGLVELGYSFWRKWNLKLLSRLGITSDAAFLAEKIDELWWDCADLQFYPDIIETLTQLRSKQIKLGVVTNAVKEDYDQILHRLKAEHYFDVVVGIDTCGKAKPDSKIFQYAVEKLRLNSSQVLFVGDSMERDYEGALKAGLKPLLIDRRGKDIKNVDSINDLTKVLDYF
jgi:putative hydrolase of the HAD superfamily